jgi:hypothetical protein
MQGDGLAVELGFGEDRLFGQSVLVFGIDELSMSEPDLRRNFLVFPHRRVTGTP